MLYGSHPEVQRCKNTEPVQLSDAFTTTVNANRTCNRVHTDLGWRACKTRPDGNCLLHSLAAGSVRAKMIFDKFDWPFAESFPLTATAWRRAIVQFIRDNALAFTLDKTWTDASLEFDLEQESPSMQEMLDGIDCRKRKTGVDTAQFQGRGLAADGVWMWDAALLNIAASIFKQLCLPNTNFQDGTPAYVRLFMPE